MNNLRKSNLFLWLVILISLWSCQNSSDRSAGDTNGDAQSHDSIELQGKDSSDSQTIMTKHTRDPDWADSLIQFFIDHGSSEMMLPDTNVDFTYIRQYMERNGRMYLVAQIGHSFEHHFLTNHWLYLDTVSHAVHSYDLVNDSLVTWLFPMGSIDTSATIPPSGFYVYEIAYAEWMGKSLGEWVSIRIKADSVWVYDRNELIEKGKLRKHKSGVWIISTSPSDVKIEEPGGCADGPNVLDFVHKKYWRC